MKNAKITFLLAFGLIAILFTGCFSPTSVVPPNVQEETAPITGDDQSFTVNVHIGPRDGRARSLAGASYSQIKGTFNFVQLVVVDKETDAIIAYDEIRRSNSAEPSAVLYIDPIPYRKDYKFLLLFGYWERNVDQESTSDAGITTFVYKDNAKPVLLAAGYREQEVQNEGTISITMWPLVIDTVFVPLSGSEVPSVAGQAVDLLQTETWKVKWDIRKKNDSGDGLEILRAASGGGSNLPVIAKKLIVDGTAQPTDATETSNAFEYSLPAYTGLTDIGIIHSVNFNLEYVPFNKTTAADWTKYNEKSLFNLASAPVWIIRNGLNDATQNDKTDFDKAVKSGDGYNYKQFNGNGGVAGKVKEKLGFTDNNNDNFPDDTGDDDNDGYPDDPGTAPETDLILYGGKFEGLSGAAEASGAQGIKISFSTRGYDGSAQVFYAIKKTGDYTAINPLPYSMFNGQPLGDYARGKHTGVGVTLPDTDHYYDVWLVFMKDKKVSNRIAIHTGSGSPDFGWIWGPDSL
jgi:hypothetical protein